MMRKTVLAFCALLFSAALLVATSYAWFSISREANSNDMQINVEVSPNLIISKTAEHIRTITLDTAFDAYSIDYSNPSKSRTNMLPSTAAVTINNEWEQSILTDGDNVTGLKYVTNTYDVDFSTGVVKDNKSLEFAPVPINLDSQFYIDYDIYIASAGKELDAQSLTATISNQTETEDVILSHLAATIVFYQGSVSSSNLRGSIAVVNSSTQSVSFNLEDHKIPLNTNTDKNPIHIIARCYFDGALMNGSTAYINSATVDTAGIILKITFTAIALPSDN